MDERMCEVLERAARAVPYLVVSEHYGLVRSIARAARVRLGRRASRSRQSFDWRAAEAIEAAAVEHGLPRIGHWAECGQTLRQMAEAYCLRAAEAGMWR